jgi:hypothetical protein
MGAEKQHASTFAVEVGNELPIDQITQVRVLNPYFYA